MSSLIVHIRTAFNEQTSNVLMAIVSRDVERGEARFGCDVGVVLVLKHNNQAGLDSSKST